MDGTPAVPEPAPAGEMSGLPRRSVAFIGSECYPFVKTGGLGDVMYALPRALVRLNCDVRVILPRYACIPKEYQDKMIYRGEFYMDLGRTGRNYYLGLMEHLQVLRGRPQILKHLGVGVRRHLKSQLVGLIQKCAELPFDHHGIAAGGQQAGENPGKSVLGRQLHVGEISLLGGVLRIDGNT